jgi:hypothetical protein
LLGVASLQHPTSEHHGTNLNYACGTSLPGIEVYLALVVERKVHAVMKQMVEFYSMRQSMPPIKMCEYLCHLMLIGTQPPSKWMRLAPLALWRKLSRTRLS